MLLAPACFLLCIWASYLAIVIFELYARFVGQLLEVQYANAIKDFRHRCFGVIALVSVIMVGLTGMIYTVFSIFYLLVAVLVITAPYVPYVVDLMYRGLWATPYAVAVQPMVQEAIQGILWERCDRVLPAPFAEIAKMIVSVGLGLLLPTNEIVWATSMLRETVWEIGEELYLTWRLARIDARRNAMEEILGNLRVLYEDIDWD